ncbi:S26 family signal peptidase [Nonomuraea sp. NPDC001831]|uniref:S26 family signal peptidase n=1 Tax=Nonomuraea sp. NPDC001831 TaxID=3364340 RepID=UPI0036A19E5B
MREPVLSILGGLTILALVGCLARWLRHTRLLVVVDGPSMEPALHDGDRMLARRVSLAALSVGDIVVLNNPHVGRSAEPAPYLVKRIAALPGHQVPRAVAPRVGNQSSVPPGYFVVLGDNTAVSCDSRDYGYLSESDLLGVVTRFLHGSTRHGRRGRSVRPLRGST